MRPTCIERLPAQMVAAVRQAAHQKQGAGGGEAAEAPPVRVGTNAVPVRPYVVSPPAPSAEVDGGDGWREFRIGSFRHPPVSLRPLNDLWTRPACVGSAADDETEELHHFLEYPGVEMQMESVGA